jgi:probable metal-binding protein
MEMLGERYGRSITFHTSSSMEMDRNGLLRFLEDRDKVRITRSEVYPGGSPACEY